LAALLLGGAAAMAYGVISDIEIVGAVGFLILICAPLVLLEALLRKVTTQIAVTSQRVIIRRGFIDRSTTEIIGGQIETLEVKGQFWDACLALAL
jgi:hypothetical protein